MAKGIHLLTAMQVRHAANGDHNDGGGLWLRVTAGSAGWVFRYTALTLPGFHVHHITQP